jgi:hypothetical protein
MTVVIQRLVRVRFAPQFALKSIERGEDEARQLGVFPEQQTGNRHYFATGSGAHASNHQRDTEKRNCRQPTLSTAKDR